MKAKRTRYQVDPSLPMDYITAERFSRRCASDSAHFQRSLPLVVVVDAGAAVTVGVVGDSDSASNGGGGQRGSLRVV